MRVVPDALRCLDVQMLRRLAAHAAGLDDPLQELARARLVRVAEHLRGWPVLQDLPLLQEADAIGDVTGEAHLVRGDDHRHARFGQLPDDV